MESEQAILELEGLQTVETVSEKLGITRQSALNLISRLKKQGYASSSGGGRQKRIYKISAKKQRKRDAGMFDIINKYSPNMKLSPWHDHQVHGPYGPEEALIDAVQTESFRVILASMRLFNHITDWPGLYRLANEKGVWQKVGALYEIARMHFKVRRMPERYLTYSPVKWLQISSLKNRKNFPRIQQKWRVFIPFNEKDMEEAS